MLLRPVCIKCGVYDNGQCGQLWCLSLTSSDDMQSLVAHLASICDRKVQFEPTWAIMPLLSHRVELPNLVGWPTRPKETPVWQVIVQLAYGLIWMAGVHMHLSSHHNSVSISTRPCGKWRCVAVCHSLIYGPFPRSPVTSLRKDYFCVYNTCAYSRQGLLYFELGFMCSNSIFSLRIMACQIAFPTSVPNSFSKYAQICVTCHQIVRISYSTQNRN